MVAGTRRQGPHFVSLTRQLRTLMSSLRQKQETSACTDRGRGPGMIVVKLQSIQYNRTQPPTLTQRNATQRSRHHATQHNTTPCNTMQCNTAQRNAILNESMTYLQHLVVTAIAQQSAILLIYKIPPNHSLLQPFLHSSYILQSVLCTALDIPFVPSHNLICTLFEEQFLSRLQENMAERTPRRKSFLASVNKRSDFQICEVFL